MPKELTAQALLDHQRVTHQSLRGATIESLTMRLRVLDIVERNGGATPHSKVSRPIIEAKLAALVQHERLMRVQEETLQVHRSEGA